MQLKRITAAAMIATMASAAGAQMVAKPGAAPPASSTATQATPLRSAPASSKSSLGAKAAATITIIQPINNGDTLRVSTGGGYRRCGLAPGTPVPQKPTSPLAAVATAAVADVQNVCTLSVPKGGTVALRIQYDKYSLIVVGGNGWKLADGQWGGDCAGTAGDTCVLDMSQSRTVNTNTAAPGGIEQPLGTTEN